MLHGKIYRKKKKKEKKKKGKERPNKFDMFLPQANKEKKFREQTIRKWKNGKNENTKREKEKEICRLSEN